MTNNPCLRVGHHTSMLRCWQHVRILVRTNHPYLRVGCHRSVARSFSIWGPKGEPDALTAAERGIVDLMRRLQLIRLSDLYIIAIRVEPEYRFVGRPLSVWGTKGVPNAPIAAGSEVADLLR
jgi:hypothetical protein